MTRAIRVPFRLVASLAVLCLAAGQADGQEQRAAVEGVVRDATGGVLPGVTVEVKGPALGRALSTTTDGTGLYRFPALPPGGYAVSASLQGFVPARVTNVELSLGQILKVDLTLKVGVEQEIVVTDEAPLIDVKQSATAASIRDEMIEKLPRGRNFTSVVTQAASAANESKLAGVSIDGASGSENRYVIDGIDTTNIQTGQSAKDVITDFVDEVQVKSSGYAAEYGGATGGVINVITKSGTANWRGDAGLYYTSDNMYGDERGSLILDPNDISKSAYQTFPRDDWDRVEPGFSVGGPIVADRAWFFAGYLPQLEVTNRTVTFASTGETVGFRNTERIHYGTANITTQLSSRLRARAAVNFNPERDLGSLPAQSTITGGQVISTSNPATDWKALGVGRSNITGSGNVDYTISNNLFFGARGGYFRYNEWDLGVPNEVWRQFVGSNSGFSDIPAELRGPSGTRNVQTNAATVRDIQTRTSVNAFATYFASLGGEHAFKAGIQFDRIGNEVFDGYQQPRALLYWDQSFLGQRGRYGHYRMLQIVTQGDVHSDNLGLFVQDSWTVNNRLTLNLGLRTESETVPTFDTSQGQADNAIDFGFKDKLAPRVGFAWDVMGDSKWKAYGSWGMFYDITKLEMPRGLFGADRWVDYYYTLDTYEWRSLGGGPCPPTCPGTQIAVIDRRHPANLPGEETIDPNLKPMRSQEFVLGLQREVGRSMSFGVRYVHKQLDRAIEDIGVFVPEENAEVFFIANPGYGIAEYTLGREFPAQPKAKRDYDGVELEFTKRFAQRWSLHASYLWSRLEGNYSGLASSDENGRTSPNVNRFFDDLRMSFDGNGNPLYGRLATDRPHQFKLQGLYDFEWGTSVGANLYMASGIPISRVAYVFPSIPILYRGRGSDGRTPTFKQVDLYLQHELRFADSSALQFSVNIENLFDSDTTTNVWAEQNRSDLDVSVEEFFAGVDLNQLVSELPVNSQDPRFLQPSEFQSARTLRFGMKYLW